jgi:hypothetical protein
MVPSRPRPFARVLASALLLGGLAALAGCATTRTALGRDGVPAVSDGTRSEVVRETPHAEHRDAPERVAREPVAREVREVHSVVLHDRGCSRCR